jgi:hypothetical protein
LTLRAKRKNQRTHRTEKNNKRRSRRKKVKASYRKKKLTKWLFVRMEEIPEHGCFESSKGIHEKRCGWWKTARNL